MAIIESEDSRIFIDAVEVYAIMIRLDGEWYPYKFFGNTKEKTRRRARENLKTLRHCIKGVTFEIQKVWKEVEREGQNGKCIRFQNVVE